MTVRKYRVEHSKFLRFAELSMCIHDAEKLVRAVTRSNDISTGYYMFEPKVFDIGHDPRPLILDMKYKLCLNSQATVVK